MTSSNPKSDLFCENVHVMLFDCNILILCLRFILDTFKHLPGSFRMNNVNLTLNFKISPSYAYILHEFVF